MEDRFSNSNHICSPIIRLGAIDLTKLSLWTRLLPAVVLLIAACSFASSAAMAGEPAWIWTPKTLISKQGSGQGECFFRKKLTLVGPEKAELIFSAGDEYEIYLNDRLVDRGQSYGESKTIDVSQFIEPGVNLLAAHVKHFNSPTPGLALKFRVKEKSETRWRSLATDSSWKTRVVEAPYWTENTFSDTGWIAAKSTSAEQAVAAKQKSADEIKKAEAAVLAQQKRAAEQLAAAKAEADKAKATAPKFTKSTPITESKSRFDINPDFKVSKVLSAKETGSLIAMEFNEFGKLLLSREGGPLMIADPTKPANDPERIKVCCDEVNSCRGILPLNGSVYVTATSQKGVGLFELNDAKNTGKLTIARQLLSFSGKLGENGPRGIQLGPEGMLYVVVGDGCEIEQKLARTSPFNDFYNDNIVPGLDDQNNVTNQQKTPGGSIIRVSLNGNLVERVAGGIHKAQDLLVDANGEIFLHDSDTQSDVGLTWHRPSLAYHVPAGADLGWRKGWSTCPTYFVDQTPALASTGRATPTGAVQYEHLQFPQRYHGSIFFADWSQGRILAAKPSTDGAGFSAKPEAFLSGRPLNVSDLSVGADGHLYFCTGGRGTEGGVYRISWNGQVPAKVHTFKNDLDRALRHPQPQSAWARQDIARLRIKMGRDWNSKIEDAALDLSRITQHRLRALQLMGMYGPLPSRQLVQTLKADRQPAIRAQIARMCVRKPEVFKNEIVLSLVADKNAYVRRVACETCVRLELEPSFDSLVPMLASENRIEALAARRLLERIPNELWQAKVLGTDNKRLFINGSAALLSQDATLEQGYEILAKSSHLMDGFLNDGEFIDMLRTVELALTKCNVEPSRVSGFTKRMINEFPSASSSINCELARILGYLKAGDYSGRLETYFTDEKVSTAERVHVAMHLLNSEANLTTDEKVSLLNALETSRTASSTGRNYDKYVEQAIGKISSSVAGADIPTVLANGHRWPEAVLTAFYKMPEKLDQKTVDAVIKMDQRMIAEGATDAASEQVRLGVIAILARDGSEAGMQYLRKLWLQEPPRQSDIVIGLSQQPNGENWAYLVGSLPKLDDLTSTDVLRKLTSVGQRPKEAKHYRHVIEAGYRLRGQGAHLAANLLQHWSGQTESNNNPNWQVRLTDWSQWYQATFPKGEAVAVDANLRAVGRYSTASIVDQIAQTGPGDALRGKHIFTKANCAACHRLGNQGQNAGPELNDLATRFSLREVVESTVDPSAVVSKRYQSKTILTVDGITHEGMAIAQTDGSYVLLNQQGKRIRIDASDIQKIEDSSVSAMPEGMLDGLTIAEIKDLMAYMTQRSNSTMADTQDAQPSARIGAMPTVQEIR